jgi:glucokinase
MRKRERWELRNFLTPRHRTERFVGSPWSRDALLIAPFLGWLNTRPTAVLERIVEVVTSLSAGSSSLRAIGVGAPGPVEVKPGVVSQAPNLPGWVDVPLARLVQERMGIPTFLANDAQAAALGELTYGVGRGVRDLIYLTVSTGIGAGILVDGCLLHGYHGGAGEVGHMIVEPEGTPCACGGRGHLARAGQYLGYAVITLVHLINPQIVVIGGGVSDANELLLGPMREVVDAGLMPLFQRDLEVVKARLGEDAGSCGAAVLAVQGLERLQNRRP